MWFNKQRQVLYLHDTDPLAFFNRFSRKGVPEFSVHKNAATLIRDRGAGHRNLSDQSFPSRDDPAPKSFDQRPKK